MQIFLELSGHPKANIKRVALAGRTVIGRSEICGLQIASPSVSRKHCEIRFSEESASVVDLDSSNGTFLGSEKITPGQEYPLTEGIRLNIGGIRFLVSFIHPAEKLAKQDESSEKAGKNAAAAAATATASHGSVLDDDEDPLPPDDDDDLLGLTATTDKPAATQNPAEDDYEDIPLVAQEDSVILGDFEEAVDEPENDELLPADDIPLVAEDSEQTTAPADPEKAKEEEFLNGESSSEIAEADKADDDILPDNDQSEILLSDDESLGSPSDEILTESSAADNDLELSDDASDDEPTDSISDGSVDDSSDTETTTSDADKSNDASNEQADESILDVEDEDQAFAFLDDDDENASKSESSASDSQLSDFLSRTGRD